ncbi:hypothetical protein [Saccharothrix australiensis]|nr:hypothetical protein [Saccharothrix australiensis]
MSSIQSSLSQRLEHMVNAASRTTAVWTSAAKDEYTRIVQGWQVKTVEMNGHYQSAASALGSIIDNYHQGEQYGVRMWQGAGG